MTQLLTLFAMPEAVPDPGLDQFIKDLPGKGAKNLDEGIPSNGSADWDTCPIDLQVGQPRALDLRKLCALTGAAVPHDIEATLGGLVPVLLVHTITPFHEPGQSPKSIWGLGYETRVVGMPSATTIALAPDTSMLDIASANQTVEMGLSLGGEIGVPSVVTEAISAVPGVKLQGVSVRAKTEQSFALTLAYVVKLLRIQAGVLPKGGARWNLYHQDERLDGQQTLVQTLQVPRGTQQLELMMKSWITVARWGGLSRKTWMAEGIERTVSLEGLEEPAG